MDILVFGLGALGTVYSCLLKKAGHRVVGFARSPAADKIKEQGVRVTGIWGDHAAELDAVAGQVEDLADCDFDLVILTVKSFDTAQVARELSRVISPETYILLAQNGYGNFEAATGFFSVDKVILARVIFGAVTRDTGWSEVTVIADDVVIGSPGNRIDKKVLDDFAAVFCQAGIPTRVSEEVMKYVWAKIIYNSSLNPLGAVFEVNYGELAETEYSRSLMNSVVREIFSLLAAMKQKTFWADADSYLEEFYNKTVPLTANHHASMLQDIRKGKKTEIDALNGAVVRLGKKYGVPTPVNEAVTLLVKAKEQMVGRQSAAKNTCI